MISVIGLHKVGCEMEMLKGSSWDNCREGFPCWSVCASFVLLMGFWLRWPSLCFYSVTFCIEPDWDSNSCVVEILCGANGSSPSVRNKSRPAIWLRWLSRLPWFWEPGLCLHQSVGPCTLSPLYCGPLRPWAVVSYSDSRGSGGCPLKNVLFLSFSRTAVPFSRVLELTCSLPLRGRRWYLQWVRMPRKICAKPRVPWRPRPWWNRICCLQR